MNTPTTPLPLNSSFTLPCIENFQAHDTQWLKPWEFVERERETFRTKEGYKAFLEHEHSRSCLYSGMSGLNRLNRITKDNPASRLHAIVADFDLSLNDEERKTFLSRVRIKPSFISRSFSGGTHAVWFLEEALPILPDYHAQQALLEHIAKELKLYTIFGGVDKKAFFNTSQVYHVGWQWQDGGGSPIPATRTALWLESALRKANLGDESLAIPLDRVAEEMQRRFPNRWEGDFDIGARGCRFWDAQADNPTAAIVTQKGMICFTGIYPFRSWLNIFGEEFIEKYKQDTLGAALRDCYFINNKFYAKVPMIAPDGSTAPSWQCYNRQNFESFLASTYGLRTRCNKELGEQESQVKQAIGRIVSQKALSGAIPFIYTEKEVINNGGNFYLNTSFVRVMKPDETASCAWAESFPWIAQFLEELFPDIIQRERFICEWAYAYQNAHKGKARNGRTIFIAGGPRVGKNFLTEVLIGPSLGGYVDASDYLLGNSRFNEHLFRSGVWILNDTVSKSDWKEREHFTKMLKKMAANITHVIEGKFKDAACINWSGRVFITLNTDPISLGLLPEIDINNRDKISLYRTCDTPINDPNAASNAQKELPAFCNYLLKLEFPEHCIGDTRWGVKGYLHSELYEAAESSGQTASFAEILDMYLESVFGADKQLEQIMASSTDWFSKLSSDEVTKELVKGHFHLKNFQNQLGMLCKRGDYPIEKVREQAKRKWRVKRDAWMRYEQRVSSCYVDEQMPF